jgi:hypothetical protein
MLCGIAWRVHLNVAGDRFDELRQLCTAAGDKASLAIAMAGLVVDHVYHGRVREGSRLASEAMALVESVGDPTLMVGLSFTAIYAKCVSAEWSEVLRWSETVIELADGDPANGNFVIGSPLATALTTRGIARYFFGFPGWRDDLQQGLDMARRADPLSFARVVSYVYFVGVTAGVLRPDDSVVRDIDDALRLAERSADDLALALTRMTLGVALVQRPTTAERDRGDEVLGDVCEVFASRGHNLSELPIAAIYSARERARRGGRDDAIPLIRAEADRLVREGLLLGWGIGATSALVEILLDRGADADVTEAEAAITRLADASADDGPVIRDIWLLRLRALLARADGDDTAYRDYRDRYRDMARTLGFEGHIDWAEAMP